MDLVFYSRDISNIHGSTQIEEKTNCAFHSLSDKHYEKEYYPANNMHFYWIGTSPQLEGKSAEDCQGNGGNLMKINSNTSFLVARNLAQEVNHKENLSG